MKSSPLIVLALAAALSTSACDNFYSEWTNAPTGKMVGSKKIDNPHSMEFNFASGMILGWQGPSGCVLRDEYRDTSREEAVPLVIEDIREHDALHDQKFLHGFLTAYSARFCDDNSIEKMAKTFKWLENGLALMSGVALESSSAWVTPTCGGAAFAIFSASSESSIQ